MYGNFTDIPFMRNGSFEERDCPGKYDGPPPKAKFSCDAVSDDDPNSKAVINPHYNCIKTPNTEKIEKIVPQVFRFIANMLLLSIRNFYNILC